MTNAIRAQKLFLRLSAIKRKHAVSTPVGYIRRNNPWGKKFPLPNKIRLEIINAVTGEKTVAYSIDESKRSLKKWLRLRNMRAQFDNMLLKPKASWFNFTFDQWNNFPIIVKVQESQFPYVIDRIGEKITINSKTTCTVYLKTTNNINYLNIISDKKKLMKNWIEQHPVKMKKKTKKKKQREFDFDDE